MRRVMAGLVLGLLWLMLSSTALAAELVNGTEPAPGGAATLDGAQVFEVHCVGCHINGGNIVRRGKNLKQRTLQRRGYDSVAAIAQLVTHGKGLMSAYGDRLTPAEVTAVAEYVLERAANNWKS